MRNHEVLTADHGFAERQKKRPHLDCGETEARPSLDSAIRNLTL
jgi:hypothetical protein